MDIKEFSEKLSEYTGIFGGGIGAALEELSPSDLEGDDADTVNMREAYAKLAALKPVADEWNEAVNTVFEIMPSYLDEGEDGCGCGF